MRYVFLPLRHEGFLIPRSTAECDHHNFPLRAGCHGTRPRAPTQGAADRNSGSITQEIATGPSQHTAHLAIAGPIPKCHSHRVSSSLFCNFHLQSSAAARAGLIASPMRCFPLSTRTVESPLAAYRGQPDAAPVASDKSQTLAVPCPSVLCARKPVPTGSEHREYRNHFQAPSHTLEWRPHNEPGPITDCRAESELRKVSD